MKKEMPNVFGKESKKKELVNNLGEIYLKIEREHQISPGDFPNLRKMQVRLKPENTLWPWKLLSSMVVHGVGTLWFVMVPRLGVCAQVLFVS